jgi:adenylate cyclase
MGTVGGPLAKRFERNLYVGVLLANYFGGAILSIYFFLASKMYPDPRSPGRLMVLMCLFGIPVVAIASVSGLAQARLRIRPALRWLAEDRTPTDAERELLSALPRRLATIGTIHWVLAVLMLTAYLIGIVRYYPGVDPIVRFALSSMLLGLVPWSLSYLVVERALRPVFALSVTEEVATLPKTMGITARLVLSWVATTGLPLSGVLISLVALDPAHRQLAMPVVFAICSLGGLAGVAVAVFTGRAILEPIQKVRGALHSIEAGDFDVALPVADSAELGDLEVGINRAALGLRERERVRDLFGRHVGADVATRAIEGTHGLGGERREATTLFVDIVASSALAQSNDPDHVVCVLNRFFEAVVRCVGAQGGFVNKFEGDGAMCVFGAPRDQHDHAARALRAARCLRAELDLLTEVDAAIGVSSGVVVAGNVGAADRYEYTVIGDPVNEASRLCDAAKRTPSRVLVSNATMLQAGTDAEGWASLGAMQLRGRTEATFAYALA